MAELLFNSSKVNLITTSSGQSGINYRKGPGTNYPSYGVAAYGKSWGRTTGNYYKMSDGIWYQVLINNTSSYAYVREDVTKFLTPKPEENKITDAEAKNIIDKLVQNDIQINEILIRSANILNQVKANGINISAYTARYKELYDRHVKRQNKIRTSNILKYKAGVKKGSEKLIDGFKSYLLYQYGINISGVGAIATGTAIIITAIAAVGLTVAAYFAFRPEYDESTTDLKVSKDLEKALSSLDPVTAEKVKQDLESQVDDAYNQGKRDQWTTGGLKTILLVGAGLAAFLIGDKFLSKNRKNG